MCAPRARSRAHHELDLQACAPAGGSHALQSAPVEMAPHPVQSLRSLATRRRRHEQLRLRRRRSSRTRDCVRLCGCTGRRESVAAGRHENVTARHWRCCALPRLPGWRRSGRRRHASCLPALGCPCRSRTRRFVGLGRRGDAPARAAANEVSSCDESSEHDECANDAAGDGASVVGAAGVLRRRHRRWRRWQWRALHDHARSCGGGVRVLHRSACHAQWPAACRWYGL